MCYLFKEILVDVAASQKSVVLVGQGVNLQE